MSYILQPPLAGRQVDLLVFHSPTPFNLSLVEQNITLNGGRACAGIQRLAQQVLLRLYTPRQLQLYPDADYEGTSFIDDVMGGSVYDQASARSAFAAARTDLLEQFNRDLLANPETPSDEQLADVRLAGIEVQGDKLLLGFSIVSQAGSSLSWVTPLTVQS